MAVTRRPFLETTGAGALLAGVPAGWAGGAHASDAPESPRVRTGIIALTDCPWSKRDDEPRRAPRSQGTPPRWWTAWGETRR